MEKDTSGTVGQRKVHLFEKILPDDPGHGAQSTECAQPSGPTHTTLGFHTCCLQYQLPFNTHTAALLAHLPLLFGGLPQLLLLQPLL